MKTKSLTLVSFLIFVGCAPHFLSHHEEIKTDPKALFLALSTPKDTLSTFRAKGRWTFHTEGGTLHGQLQVRAKFPDSIWVKIEGPLGIDILTFRVAERLVTAYSPWMGEPLLDVPDSLWLRTFVPFDLKFFPDSFFFLGQVIPRTQNGDSLISFFKRGKFYVAHFSNQETWWIDPRGPVISQWEKKDETGKPIFWYKAQRFKTAGEYRIPRMMQWGAGENHAFSLFYEEIHTNEAFKPGWCHVKIPFPKKEEQ